MKKLFARLLVPAAVFSFATVILPAQTTIAFQGGEGTAADNWNFTAISSASPVGPNAPGITTVNPRTGTRSIRAGGGNNTGTSGVNCISGGNAVGCGMHGNTIQFDPVNVQCLSGVVITAYHRSQGCGASLGSGFDTGESVFFEVSLNGGAWTAINTLTGSGDYNWDYTTNPAGAVSTAPNPISYNVPGGTSTVAFRARCNSNRSDEFFYLDDVRITTTTSGYSFPGTPGLWNGLSNNNWFNACNWDDRTVPTPATNVTFPVGSTNDCVIQSGQNCQCNNFSITGTSGRKFKGEGDPTKVLTVFGNLTMTTSVGSNVLDFSDGITGTPDGTINLYGNWVNATDETDFKQGEGVVNLLGSANQDISLSTAQPYEVFCSINVNKPSGVVTLSKSITIEGTLTLTNGVIQTGANHVYVFNNATASVAGHSTLSYVNGNLRRRIITGAGTRTYDYPVGTASQYELASLNLVNPAGSTWIQSAFSSPVTGAAPSITESSVTYDIMLDAGFWAFTSDVPYTGNSYEPTLNERGYTNGGAGVYINVYRTNSAAAWTNPGTQLSYSEAGATVTANRNGWTAMGEMGIARPTTPLPVELIDFEAHAQDNGEIMLLWHATGLAPGGKFEVYRVGEEGAEEFVVTRPEESDGEYAGIDGQAPQGLVVYRLYERDVNGQKTLAGSAYVLKGEGAKLHLWPNPSSDEIHLSLPSEGDWTVAVFTTTGSDVLFLTGDRSMVEQAFSQEAVKLSPGLYLLTAASPNMAPQSTRFLRK
jgi:hypothetical protein